METTRDRKLPKLNKEQELFVDSEGKIYVVNGIEEVGINKTFDFSAVYKYPMNGFPRRSPEMLCGETFWAAVARENPATVADDCT